LEPGENNMPKNCQKKTIEDVVRFFEDEIDGTGKKDGYPRNEGVIYSIKSWGSAKICNLSESEFFSLILPDKIHIHLKEKRLEDVTGDDSIFTVKKYLKQLEEGDNLPALIVREALPWDLKNSSFYIEDGAHKALAYKKYFLKNPYKPVKAYIGSLKSAS